MSFICSSKEKEGRRGGKATLKKRLRLGTHPNFFEHFVWVSSNPNLYKCDFNCFSSVCGCLSWLWSIIEECLYKENVGVLGEMLSKIFQNPRFCLGHNLAITHPN